MKHIRQRIMWLILAAALLLFCLCLIVVNVMIPDHFVREAKKALMNEIQQADRVLLPHYNEETYDTYYDTGREDAEEEYFFTPNIVFQMLHNKNLLLFYWQSLFASFPVIHAKRKHKIIDNITSTAMAAFEIIKALPASSTQSPFTIMPST